MSKNKPPQYTVTTTTAPSPAGLGSPRRVQSLHPTQIPGSGATQSVFSTAAKAPRAMHDYGGFTLSLHDYGVIIGNDSGRLLLPWSQVMCVEFE